MYMISEKALYNWAESKFGTSRCRRIKFCNNASGDYGSYDWEGTIRINLRMCRSPRTIYKVIAHEWTHAQQSYRAYKYWLSRTTYWKHPLEREARHREKLV
jgi:predicted metal-dependent hydrolase